MVSKLDNFKRFHLKATALKRWLFSLSSFQYAISLSVIAHLFSIIYWGNSSGFLTIGKSVENSFFSDTNQNFDSLKVRIKAPDMNDGFQKKDETAQVMPEISEGFSAGSINKSPSEPSQVGGGDLGLTAPSQRRLGSGYRGFLKRPSQAHTQSSQPVTPTRCPVNALSSEIRYEPNCETPKIEKRN